MRIQVDDTDDLELVKTRLSYEDLRFKFELSKLKKSYWFKDKYGEDVWKAKIEELQAKKNQCLLQEDERGYWTYTGLFHYLIEAIDGCQARPSKINYPEPQGWKIPWAEKPQFSPYPFQEQSKELLLSAKHGAVSLGTGLGKSFIILLLAKELGLKTVIMAPWKAVAKRLYNDFLTAFGPKYVGFFGDGQKQTGKLFTIAIAASLSRVVPESREWEALRKTQVFIADESHQCPADTLARVCLGLVADAPWRFFFSATQMREDGLDLLLKSIIGPIVYEKTVKQGIDEGYLANLHVYMMKVRSPFAGVSSDPNENTRDHFYYNKNILRLTAELTNYFVNREKRRVLILVEELEQFAKLLPYLKVDVRFAHGGTTKENAGSLPEAYQKSDPTALVEQFNDEQFPVLVGTSCITTGCDLKANEVTFFLQGNKAEIPIWQGALGRSTRKFKFKDGRLKTDCRVIDFDVPSIPSVHRHSQMRKQIYQLVSPVRDIDRETS